MKRQRVRVRARGNGHSLLVMSETNSRVISLTSRRSPRGFRSGWWLCTMSLGRSCGVLPPSSQPLLQEPKNSISIYDQRSIYLV